MDYLFYIVRVELLCLPAIQFVPYLGPESFHCLLVGRGEQNGLYCGRSEIFSPIYNLVIHYWYPDYSDYCSPHICNVLLLELVNVPIIQFHDLICQIMGA